MYRIVNLEEHQSNIHGEDFFHVVFLCPKLQHERQRNLVGVSAFERFDCTHQRCTGAIGRDLREIAQFPTQVIDSLSLCGGLWGQRRGKFFFCPREGAAPP